MEEVIEHLAEPGVVQATPRQEIADLLPVARRARRAMTGLILYLKSSDDRGKSGKGDTQSRTASSDRATSGPNGRIAREPNDRNEPLEPLEPLEP